MKMDFSLRLFCAHSDLPVKIVCLHFLQFTLSGPKKVATLKNQKSSGYRQDSQRINLKWITDYFIEASSSPSFLPASISLG